LSFVFCIETNSSTINTAAHSLMGSWALGSVGDNINQRGR